MRGGKGTVLIFGAFVVGSAYQEIATACGLAMTVVDDGWNFYFAWAVDDCCSAGAVPLDLRVWIIYGKQKGVLLHAFFGIFCYSLCHA